MIVPFFGLATLWATFSKIWAIFSNLLVTLASSNSQVAEQSTPYPKVEGSNPAHTMKLPR
jgi:hypothetical protein